MSSKILNTFLKCQKEKRPALLTYTVAGDSTKKQSLDIIKSISQHADIIELGFPHNTPIADGGQIIVPQPDVEIISSKGTEQWTDK